MHSCATRPVAARVEHRVVRAEPARDVVRGQHGDLGRVGEAGAAHQAHVRPRDRQDARAAERRGGDRPDARGRARPRRPSGGSAGTRRQVRADRHRADARAAAAVRDAERLVQVQVADVAAEPARLRESEQGVEVRAVHVHLAARGVHELAERRDALLEHAVGRGVGDHDRREPLGVRGQPWRSGPPGRRCRRRRSRRRRPACPPSPRTRRSCRAPRTGSGRRRGARPRWPCGTRGSQAARRARPVSRRSAAATPCRSR